MVRQLYASIIDLHANALFRFIAREVRDPDEAKDLLQETFLRLWMNVDRVDAMNGRSYLYTTAKHLVIDRARSRKHTVRFESWHDEQYACVQPLVGVQDLVEVAMNRLPAVQRKLLRMRAVEGHSYKELMARTGMDMPRVKVYLCRARKAMRTYLNDPALIV